MPKTLEFHNTPHLVREYVNNWLTHARKDKKKTPAELAVLEDILTLIDVALTVLEPVPAEPANNKN